MITFDSKFLNPKFMIDENKKVVLNRRLLDRILHVNTDKHRAKSDSIPNAQTETLCDMRNAPGDEVMSLKFYFDKLSSVDKHVAYICELQYLSGSRIQAILDLKYTDITVIGGLRVKQGKGSEPLYINTVYSSSYLMRCKINNVNPFQHLNRFYIYRIYKQCGIGSINSNGTRWNVTHFFRQLIAQSQQQSQFTIEETAKTLGQKTTKSTKYYRHG